MRLARVIVSLHSSKSLTKIGGEGGSSCQILTTDGIKWGTRNYHQSWSQGVADKHCLVKWRELPGNIEKGGRSKQNFCSGHVMTRRVVTGAWGHILCTCAHTCTYVYKHIYNMCVQKMTICISVCLAVWFIWTYVSTYMWKPEVSLSYYF